MADTTMDPLARSSRDSGDLKVWWMPVSSVVVGDLAYMETVGLVYEVTAKTDDGTLLRFSTKVRVDLSAPRFQDVDPNTIDDLNLVFANRDTRFCILRSTDPPPEFQRSFPC